MEAYLDRRVDGRDLGTHHVGISVELAVEMLLKLDSRGHTLFCLERPDGWTLMIGGGPEFSVVSLADPDGYSSTLVSGALAGGGPSVDLCAGGQWADFAPDDVVPAAMAETALRRFFDGREADLDWKPD